MSKFLVVLGVLLVALAGCQPAADTPPSHKETETIDYASWPELTKEPVRVPPEAFAYCRPSAYEKKLGPHFKPELRLYANTLAATHLREDRPGSLPVGSAIVKEKWWDDKKVGYAAMIKKEPGYDPEHGDWEYVYVQLGQKEKVDRGKIQSCIDCHARAAATDYLFRTHLKDAK